MDPRQYRAPTGDPWAELRTRVASEIASRLGALGATVRPEDLEREIAAPPEGMGDLAVPLFRYAKPLRRSPQDLASLLADGFPLGRELTSAASAGGFLNLTASVPWLAEATFARVFSAGDKYGHGTAARGKVCVEHTSANPTGQLHVGRSRNSLIGDTYARVLSAAGYSVEVQFYVDDIGRQAATLVWIWSKPGAQWPASVREKSGVDPDRPRPEGMKPDEWRGKPYPSASEVVKQDPEAAREVSELTARFERGEIPPEEYRKVPKEILDGVLASLARVGVHFDAFVWESDLILDGSVRAAVDRLSRTPHAVREEGGALAFDASSYGLPKDLARVMITRSDGSDLYIARDVAYHARKLAGFDRVIDVIGEDHKMHFRSLVALLSEMGFEHRPEVMHYAFVNLPEGKMSTRAGRAVLLDDILDEARERARKEVSLRREDFAPEEVERVAESVGAGAVRFHILAIQPDKPIVFRWEEALSFTGKSGPFVQYSFARAASLLRKAAESGQGDLLAGILRGETRYLPIPDPPDPREVELLKSLSHLPALVTAVAESGSVHLLALYAHEVSERLNTFYQSIRILGGETGSIAFRLALVAAARQVLKNVLTLIGVEPLDRM